VRSVRSIFFGLLILLAASALLFWNEGRTLAEARALAEGAGLVTAVNSTVVDPLNEGKLVQLTAQTAAARAIRDGDLGIESDGLRPARKVEMFQWKEAHSSHGGSSEADFTYSRTWSDEPIDWTKFRFPQDHRNPPMPRFASRDFAGEEAKLGAFHIDERITAKLGPGQPFNVPAETIAVLGDKLGQPAQPIQGGIFAGADPAAPRIGDVRILYTLLPHQTVSVVGRQTGDRITPFKALNGDQILLARAGRHEADEMFDFAQGANTAQAWGLRLFGALIVYLGCRVILHPLRMIASYIPVIDSLASLSAAIVALLATLIIAPTVIGLAWLAYRPLTALLVAGSGVGLAWCVVAYHHRNRPGTPAALG
jgi:hypothetical protein